MTIQSQPPSPDPDTEARLETLTDLESLNTCSLVLSAAGISHRIQITQPRHFEVFVSLAELNSARDELEKYCKENSNWPYRIAENQYAPLFKAMSLMVIAGLMYIYSESGVWSTKSLWFIAGAGDSELILKSHEYYRLVTALTLHADLVHLLSNCFLGAFLLHFLLLTTGNGIGLFTVLASSIAANFINVAIHGPGHHFVGFSTAVFVVIGMLCTIGFSGKRRHAHYRIAMSIMAGLALLALLGSSGERTDLGAHLFGLACGLLAGYIIKLPRFDRYRNSLVLQTTLTVAAFGIVFICWRYAFLK